MRIDHVSYAAGPKGLHATADELAATLGVDYVEGGNHPRFGTRNVVIPLRDARYVEVVEALDHPACDKEPFGQATRARTEQGGGWLGWVVSMYADEFETTAKRLDKTPYPGVRHLPDGNVLRWQQLGAKGLVSDPQLPYYITWETSGDVHPSQSAGAEAELAGLTIAGDSTRLRAWLGLQDAKVGAWEEPIDFSFISPHGQPGLDMVTFTCPKGRVDI